MHSTAKASSTHRPLRGEEGGGKKSGASRRGTSRLSTRTNGPNSESKIQPTKNIMQRGPKSLPTSILKQRGSRIRGRTHEAQIPAGIPQKPHGLPRDVAKWFAHYASMLSEAGLATCLDQIAVLRLAETTAEYFRLHKHILKNGIMVRRPSGVMVLSPVYHARLAAGARELRLLAEFGLTPASRVRVPVSPKPEEIVTQSYLDQ
jgi:P27 family predicted phage terminase small subunit